MQRTIRIFIILMVFSLGVVSLTTAQGDQPSISLNILNSGEVVDDVFFDNVTARIYGFNAKAGDVITITMAANGGSTLDPILVILGSAGQVITLNDDGPDGTLNSQVDMVAPYDGGYFILASTFEWIDDILEFVPPTTPQSYRLTITGNTLDKDADPDNERLSYFRSELTYNTPFEGYSNAEEPVYYFIFDATAGDVVNITASSTDINPLVQLYAGGDRIAVNNNASEATTDSAISNVTLQETGTYLIFVTDAFFTLNGDDYVGGNFIVNVASTSSGSDNKGDTGIQPTPGDSKGNTTVQPTPTNTPK
jgi:hypothetical protein